MSERRIAVVVTARPSFARIQTVLEALQGRCDLRIVMAGSALLHHYGAVADACPFPIAARIPSTLDGQTLETTTQETGLLTIHLARLFADWRPDWVVTIADRHETLATAIAASYQHLPLAHLQGGERTGSIDDKVRNAVSMLADLHFPATMEAAARLRQMGVRGSIFEVGCPSIDLAARARPAIDAPGRIVVLQHPVTNEVAAAAAQIDATVAAIRTVASAHHPVTWFWPGQDAGSEAMAKRLREHRDVGHLPHVTFTRHLPPEEFLGLMKICAVLVGNSSVGLRECEFLGTPVVNIGTRQTGRDTVAHATTVPYDATAIAIAIRGRLAWSRTMQSTYYGTGDAGRRIADVLLEATHA
jgi:UDP-hydrolysing UDP-N-acetyl-D-glucosamine 2-epimerase